jgi:TonB family protein
MGLWEFLRQWQGGRLAAGIVTSVLIHVLLAWAVLSGLSGSLSPRLVPKKGDTIIVELPKPDEPANAGNPSAPPAPARPPAPPVPSRPSVASRPVPPARETPPAPHEERRVASAPRPAEPPIAKAPEPAPRSPEPTPSAAEPAPRAAEPAPSAAEPAPRAVEPAPRPPAQVEARREGGERQVAALPPRPAAPSVGDVRAALRGAGGQGQGRGGIVGDPIPLDSEDQRYSEYLEQVRQRIKEKWGFPCVRRPGAGECEPHTTSLEVEFGILKDGRVQFVDLVRSADHGIYDEYALNAIRLAQPFPPVPPAMMAAMRQGSTGLAIRARFLYVAEAPLMKLLR